MNVEGCSAANLLWNDRSMGSMQMPGNKLPIVCSLLIMTSADYTGALFSMLWHSHIRRRRSPTPPRRRRSPSPRRRSPSPPRRRSLSPPQLATKSFRCILRALGRARRCFGRAIALDILALHGLQHFVTYVAVIYTEVTIALELRE